MLRDSDKYFAVNFFINSKNCYAYIIPFLELLRVARSPKHQHHHLGLLGSGYGGSYFGQPAPVYYRPTGAGSFASSGSAAAGFGNSGSQSQAHSQAASFAFGPFTASFSQSQSQSSSQTGGLNNL